MPKRKGYESSKSSVAWRLTVCFFLGGGLAASLWWVVRTEQKWATTRQARGPIGRPTEASPSDEEALARRSTRDTAPSPETTDTIQPAPAPPARDDPSVASPLRDRHRLGPEQAAIQMVMFFDYECQRCQRVEQDVRALMKRFPGGISLSLRHYPQSTDCNHTLKVNSHPSACQAARAAEAAGILKGESGFWEMHAWLLQRRGHVSIEDLRDALPSLGYEDVDGFLEAMNGAEPLQNVLRDLLDAATLPNVVLGTVVMNGVQLEGDEVEDAMAQAVRFLEGQSPTAALAQLPDVSSSPQRPFPDELLATAIAATVQILNASNGDQGSGVMVAKDRSMVYVLTADHLLGSHHRPTDDRQSVVDRGERLQIRAFSATTNESIVYRSVHVVARSRDDDLAVLSFSTRHAVPALLPICSPQRIPDDKEFPVLAVGWEGGGVPTSVAGKVSAKKRVRRGSKGPATLVWELNKPSKPGQSGGPLVDRQGCVVGVASGNSGGHGYFCHTELIHRLLDKNGLKWLYTPADELNGAR